MLRCRNGRFARCFAQSRDEALLAPDVFGPGDRTAYSWVSQKGVLTLGVPPWSRAAAIVRGLQSRIALSAAVIVCILQEELVLSLKKTKRCLTTLGLSYRKSSGPLQKMHCAGGRGPGANGFESSTKVSWDRVVEHGRDLRCCIAIDDFHLTVVTLRQ